MQLAESRSLGQQAFSHESKIPNGHCFAQDLL